MKIHFVSLGCPRNLIDTEMMLGQLLEAGHMITSDTADADCVVVNTCSFIRPAVEESIDTILEMAQWKKEAQDRRLIVTGCLPERYRDDLLKTLPEVDAFLGTGAFHKISEVVGESFDAPPLLLPEPVGQYYDTPPPRLQTTPSHTAFLKIAEGCSGRCTYCIIPKLRGPQRSRAMEEILDEAETLADAGVKELILVAQNTTAYGHDQKNGENLEQLLARLAQISHLTWIRVLYGHPDYMTDPLIETIAAHENICPYFDIPIQHISERILKRMGRNHDSSHIIQLFDHLRSKVPGAVLRTSLITGFPGETDRDFEILFDFISRLRFDHLGVFIYSDEEDLPSSGLKGHVSEEVKKIRCEQLMRQQAAISRENLQQYIGKTIKVVVDESPATHHGQKIGQAQLIGRSVFQAPGIDGVVRIAGNTDTEPGSFVSVKITDGDDYDLTGELIV